jgi:SAM-dependent methyltransferase
MFLPLGDHPLANGFLRESQLTEPEVRFPLDVHACLNCGLIQVANQVPPDFFRHYVYVPSAAESMHSHFAAFARSVAERFLNDQSALTVDIGCNDGLFLSSLQRRGARTLGIDPAANIAQIARAKGLEVVTEYFSPALAQLVRTHYGPARVIVSTNTFHHIGDLDQFTLGVSQLLSEDGVFIVEVPHALELIELNQFDGVYHEHVSQLTVKSFVDHYRRFGLEVFEVERLDVHGGSMRVFGRPARQGGSMSPSVREWIDYETERGLFEAATYDAFRERVEHIKRDLMELLRALKSGGSRIAGYGASARGNTLLNYYGIGPDLLEYIIDRNPLKQGLFSPGMHIPVVGAERLLEDQPDYTLLLAWNFGQEIMAQQDTYRRRGGKFILPIPTVQVVD